MIQGMRWDSKMGCWVDGSGNQARNPEPSYVQNNNGDIIHAYFTELASAHKAGDGEDVYDFSKFNARTLVWKLGNHKKLGAIRNLISKFSKQTGNKFVTLSSRVSAAGKSEAQQIAEAEELFAALDSSHGISRLIQK